MNNSLTITALQHYSITALQRLTLHFSLLTLLLIGLATPALAEDIDIASPDGLLALRVSLNDGQLTYSVSYDGETALLSSPLGLVGNFTDLSADLTLTGQETRSIDERYELNRCKAAHVHYVANELRVEVENKDGQQMSVLFRISNNNIAFRYEIPKSGETGSIRVMEEKTAFRFPDGTTTFLTPQSDAMIAWKRTKPSYEEVYTADAPMDSPSQYGHGYTFPCLFHTDNLWTLVSETGVDSRYCGSHLSDYQGKGLYQIAFPMAEENNGNGTPEPAFALPGNTPWRTLTVGNSLKPIVETTIPFDNVQPRYETTHDYQFGRGTWSWIVWQDNSINYDDQVRYINLAAQMGYEYVLIDNFWDTNIGRERMERLVDYAKGQGVSLFLWYSSSGYWNDITQGPVNRMDNAIIRKKEMAWLEKIGVKGIKVDFFGGDKQETMRLYEEILSDADDHGLMVIFHGCTLPRGWERMYPNYVGSEAVLASENMVFGQSFCDNQAFNACLHPFIRNAVGCMEWGGTFMNRRLAKGNASGTVRKSTDAFELATAILYQNPIQNFALTPENLNTPEEGGAPQVSMNFMKTVPTTWDETRLLDGYPGKYVVLARRHHATWYIVGVNAENEPKKLTLDLSDFMEAGDNVQLYSDNLKNQDPKYEAKKLILSPAKVKITMDTHGGFVMVK